MPEQSGPTTFVCPDCHATQPEPGRCGRCPGTVRPATPSGANERARELEAAFMRLRVRVAEYDDTDLEIVLDELVETRVERAEAERVIRVTAGWNPDRVTVLEAIEPAVNYLRAKAIGRG